MRFRLSKYIFPSVVSMVLVGAYTNIDGLFIGNAAGDDGIAAINIVWPVVAFITALGTGIGTGGAIAACNRRGAGDAAGAKRAGCTAFLLLAAGGLAVTPLLFFGGKLFLRLSGAEGQVLRYAEAYASVVSLGAVFQIAGAGLVVLLRGEGKTFSAMAGTALGLAVHVLLDWLLVQKYAMYGVALSTVAAQAVVVAAALPCFCLRRGAAQGDPCGDRPAGAEHGAHCSAEQTACEPCPEQPSPCCAEPSALQSAEQSAPNGAEPFAGRKGKRALASVGEILRLSVAPFGVNFVSSVVLLVTNYFALRTGGTAAVCAYGVMSYAFFTFDYVFQGVCDGVQPVLSYCAGAGDYAQKRRAARCAVILLAALSALFACMTPLLIKFLPAAFSVSAEAAALMRNGLIAYAFSYPLKAAVKWICAYAYSHRRGKIANVCIFADPLLFTPLFLAVLPSLLGTDGLWLALPLTQAAVFAVGAVLTAVAHRRAKGDAYVSR